jgi:ABC-2 type transport system permease protein
MAGGASIAFVQAVLMLCLMPVLGLTPSVAGAAGLLAGCALLALACDAVGYAAAWTFKSSQGFHAFMNVALIPVWLMSGAVFPAGSSVLLKTIMTVDPMRYGLELMRGCLDPAAVQGSLSVDVLVTVGFAVVAVGVAFVRASRVEADA